MRTNTNETVGRGDRFLLLSPILLALFLLKGFGSFPYSVYAQDCENWLKTEPSQNQIKFQEEGHTHVPPLQKAAGEADPLTPHVTLAPAAPFPPFRTIPEILTQWHRQTGVNFLITCGEIEERSLSFGKLPLTDALDALLIPLNLTWEKRGEVILVKHEIMGEQMLRLTDAEVRIFKTFQNQDWFNHLLFAPLSTTVPPPPWRVDEQQGVLYLTAGRTRLKTLEKFLGSLRQSGKPDLRGNMILLAPPGQAGEIHQEIQEAEARDYTRPPDKKRAMHTGGDYLVLESTQTASPEVEKTLTRAIEGGRLQNPNELDTLEIHLDTLKPELAQTPGFHEFCRRLYDAIEKLLYTGVSRSVVAQDGRKLLPSREHLEQSSVTQLTVVDFPHRIAAVQRYLERAKRETEITSTSRTQTSLSAPVSPASRPSRRRDAERMEIVPLRYQPPATMAAMLDQVYASRGNNRLTTARRSRRPAEEAFVTEFTLHSPENEHVWRDLVVRLVRVAGEVPESDASGSASPRRESSCELAVRTNIRGTQRLTLSEYNSQVLDNYELTVIRIRLGGGRAGGSVSLRVRYLPSSN